MMIGKAMAIAGLLGALVSPALAGQRIDLYDRNSRREGFAILNERQGRVDFYDTYSRRRGYAKLSGQRPAVLDPKAPAAWTAKPSR